AFAFGSLLVVFTDLGTNMFLLKEVSRANGLAGKYLKNILAIKLIPSLLVCLAAVIIPKGSPQVSLAVTLFTISLVISAFLDPLNAVFRAHKQMYYETAVMLVWRLLLVGLSIAGLYLLDIKLTGLALIFIASSALALALSSVIAGTRYNINLASFSPQQLEPRKWGNMIRDSLPMGALIIISSIFFKLNIVILPYFSSPQEVGWYSASFKLVEGTFFIPSIFLGSLFPFLCMHNKKDTIAENSSALFKRSFIFLLLLATAGACAVTLFPGKVISVLFGQEFMPAVKPLVILAWSLVFIYLNELFVYLFLSVERQASILKILTVALAAYLLLSVILIPGYGYIGASWVLFGTQALIFVMNLSLLRRVR
ncbi:MAG: oligosaccharide flippase family protein, partial [Endomicrobiales bacterium]